MRSSLLVALLVLASACVQGQDDPTLVHDLRVLGMQFEPPEVLLEACNAQTLQALAGASDGGANLDPRALFQIFSAAIVPLQFKALIVDPKGNGRALSYSLSVCTDASDQTCSNADKRLLLARGQFTPTDTEPALSLQVSPVSASTDAGAPSIRTLPDGNSVLIDVVQNDLYKGLGGIRVPMVLEVIAADTNEHLYAQKLMPYTCKFLPAMTQNVQPVLPGITINGTEWPMVGDVTIMGRSETSMDAVDFTSLQETYVLPSLQLKPVTLSESWKIAHYATSGTMSPAETGGTNLGGGVSHSAFTWTPDSTASEPLDVMFYFVVRDGRGGESWLLRKAHWSP